MHPLQIRSWTLLLGPLAALLLLLSTGPAHSADQHGLLQTDDDDGESTEEGDADDAPADEDDTTEPEGSAPIELPDEDEDSVPDTWGDDSPTDDEAPSDWEDEDVGEGPGAEGDEAEGGEGAPVDGDATEPEEGDSSEAQEVEAAGSEEEEYEEETLVYVNRPEPKYPDEAVRNLVEGRVAVQLMFNEGGTIETAEIITGPDGLREVVQETIQTWEIKPFVRNGEAIPMEVSTAFVFQLPANTRVYWAEHSEEPVDLGVLPFAFLEYPVDGIRSGLVGMVKAEMRLFEGQILGFSVDGEHPMLERAVKKQLRYLRRKRVTVGPWLDRNRVCYDFEFRLVDLPDQKMPIEYIDQKRGFCKS
jgi:TonB family protein